MLKHWSQGLQIDLPNLMVSFFPALGPIQGHKVQHYFNFGQIEKIFSSSALTPNVKPLGLISTLASIGMLDLGWTLALTPSVKWALLLSWVFRCSNPMRELSLSWWCTSEYMLHLLLLLLVQYHPSKTKEPIKCFLLLGLLIVHSALSGVVFLLGLCPFFFSSLVPLPGVFSFYLFLY